MSNDKTREILDMLVKLHNERSFLAAAAAKMDLLAISYTNRTMARDLLDIINELAYGELVDINHVNSHYVNGVVCDEIIAEWA